MIECTKVVGFGALVSAGVVGPIASYLIVLLLVGKAHSIHLSHKV